MRMSPAGTVASMAVPNTEPPTVSLRGTPYSLEATSDWMLDEVSKLHSRVSLLRAEGKLTEATLRAYFGDKRFEQVAESNAIEGSPLDVGETRLAIERGMTIPGHDAAYSQDAVNLSAALERMVELARSATSTTNEDVKDLHSLVLGGSPGAGVFRSEPVVISGSPHVPPSNWADVMSAMEDWELWSLDNSQAPALLRAVVLHTWLTHIHPFADGNGRTSRAVMNLELVRGGFPSVIIRRKDRLRYYDALAESDLGGDLEPISGLILQRAEDALRDLERVAAAQQGYDRVRAEFRQAQIRRTAIWNDAVRLLFSLVENELDGVFGESGHVSTRWYDAELTVDDYVALSEGDSSGNSWLVRFDAEVPGVGHDRFLAWTGYRSYEMRDWNGIGGGPAIFWSIADPTGYRMWLRDDASSPGVAEMTLQLPDIDQWVARMPNGEIKRLRSSAVAGHVAQAMASSVTASP